VESKKINAFISMGGASRNPNETYENLGSDTGMKQDTEGNNEILGVIIMTLVNNLSVFLSYRAQPKISIDCQRRIISATDMGDENQIETGAIISLSPCSCRMSANAHCIELTLSGESYMTSGIHEKDWWSTIAPA
jgi:hypothetical protein